MVDTSGKRDDNGRFTSNVGREDVLTVMEPGEPYGTRELADILDIPRRTAYKYLSELNDEGHVRKKEIDGRSVIWMKSE